MAARACRMKSKSPTMASEVVWHLAPSPATLPTCWLGCINTSLLSAPGTCQACLCPKVFTLSVPSGWKLRSQIPQVCLLLILWVSAQMLPPSRSLHRSLYLNCPVVYLSPLSITVLCSVYYHFLPLWIYLISLFAFLFAYLSPISPYTTP